MNPREFQSGASPTAPNRPASPSTGYPSAGNPGAGVAPTVPGPYWHHQIGEELRAVIAAAGLTPDATSLTQLLQAVNVLTGRAVALLSDGAGVFGLRVGTWAIQWGSITGSNVNIDLRTPYKTAAILVFVTNNDVQGSNVDNAYGYPINSGRIYVATKASGGGVSSYPVSWLTIGELP